MQASSTVSDTDKSPQVEISSAEASPSEVIPVEGLRPNVPSVLKNVKQYMSAPGALAVQPGSQPNVRQSRNERCRWVKGSLVIPDKMGESVSIHSYGLFAHRSSQATVLDAYIEALSF